MKYPTYRALQIRRRQRMTGILKIFGAVAVAYGTLLAITILWK